MKRALDPTAIEAAMRTRDVSYAEVAAVGGCSKPALVNYVAGRRALPPDLAYRIARFLRRPVAALFVDEVATSEPSNGNQKASA